MADDLEQRLESHGRSFEGLMSLIPAKLYYEQDNSDQWRRKKATKEEKKAARRAKLDPRNIISAKDVMDENERKRKREAGEEDDEPQLSDHEGRELPREGLKTANKSKKQKVDGQNLQRNDSRNQEDEEKQARNTERRREKRARQYEKKQSDKQKEKEKKKQKREKLKPLIQAAKEAKTADTTQTQTNQKSNAEEAKEESEDEDEEDEEEADEVTPAVRPASNPTSGSTNLTSSNPFSSDSESNVDSTFSPVLDRTTATSESSVDDNHSVDVNKAIPATQQPTSSSDLSIMPPPALKESKETLRARLESKIAALRAARKADGLDGKPIRTRQELIEHRRTKELERKQRKKKQREADNALNKAQDEADQKARAEAELARLRGDAGSPITSSSRSHSVDPLPKSKLNLDGLAYSRLSFNDGAALTALNHRSTTASKPVKGPMDPKSALAKATAHAARLAGLDDSTRADIESKELWNRARQRVAGEKPRDDVSLLKKTLKKREKQKMKSEREWNERKEGVEKAREARQRKREGNLAKRREEKGGKKKKGKKSGHQGKGKNVSSDKQKAKRARHKAFG